MEDAPAQCGGREPPAWGRRVDLLQIGSEDKRAVQRRNDGVVAGQSLLPESHGQGESDGVALLPDLAQGEVRARICYRYERVSVDLHARIFRRPVGNAYVDGERRRTRRLDFEGRALLARKLRDLLKDKALIFQSSVEAMNWLTKRSLPRRK